MIGHGRVRPLDVPFRIRRAQARQLLERAAPRNVAVELVVGRGLIGDEIGQDVAGEQPLEQIHGIRLDADRDGLSRVLRGEGAIDGTIDVGLFLVQIAGLQPLLDALRIHLGHQRDRSVHRRGERLRAAHPAETGRHDQPAREIAPEVPGRGRKRLERSLDDALAADVDPRARCHLAVHGQAEAFQAAELVARRPGGNEHGVRDQDARERLRGSRTRRRPSPTERASFRWPSGASRSRRWCRTLPSCARPGRCRRRRSALRAFPPRPDRGCSRASGGRLPAASRGSGAALHGPRESCGRAPGRSRSWPDYMARRFGRRPSCGPTAGGRSPPSPPRRRERPSRSRDPDGAPGRRSRRAPCGGRGAARAPAAGRRSAAAGTPSPETPR